MPKPSDTLNLCFFSSCCILLPLCQTTVCSCPHIVKSLYNNLGTICRAEILILNEPTINRFWQWRYSRHQRVCFISDMKTQRFTHVIRWIEDKQCAVPVVSPYHAFTWSLWIYQVWNILYQSCESVKHLTNAFFLIKAHLSSHFKIIIVGFSFSL